MERADPPRSTDAHRLFFALWPDEPVRASLQVAAEGVGAFKGGRRTAPGKYHLTLHYLGTWHARPEEVIARARRAGASVQCSGFHLIVDHAGHFPRARVGWLAPSGSSGLDAVWSALAHALDAAGIERRASETFSPHVTVVRDLRVPAVDATIDRISWPVDDFVLVHSNGGHYEVVERWPLPASA